MCIINWARVIVPENVVLVRLEEAPGVAVAVLWPTTYSYY